LNISGDSSVGTVENKGTATISGGSVDTVTNEGTATISGGDVTTVTTTAGTANISGGTIETVNANGGTTTVAGSNTTETKDNETTSTTTNQVNVGTINVSNSASVSVGTTKNETTENSVTTTVTDNTVVGKINVESGSTTISNGTIDTVENQTAGEVKVTGGNVTTVTNEGKATVDGGSVEKVENKTDATVEISGGNVTTVTNEGTATVGGDKIETTEDGAVIANTVEKYNTYAANFSTIKLVLSENLDSFTATVDTIIEYNNHTINTITRENSAKVTFNVATEAQLTAAIGLAKDGDTVKLTADIENVSKTIAIENKSITIDGTKTVDNDNKVTATYKITTSGSTVYSTFTVTGGSVEKYADIEANLKTVTFQNIEIVNLEAKAKNDTLGNIRPACIETKGGTLTLTLDNVKLQADDNSSGHGQPLTVNGVQTYTENGETKSYKITVDVKNSTIDASNNNGTTVTGCGYAMLVLNPVDLTVDHSTVSGYCSIYLAGNNIAKDEGNRNYGRIGTDGSTVKVTYSTLKSYLQYSGSTDGFGVIVLESPCYGEGTEVTVENSVITAEGNNDAVIYAVLFNDSYYNDTEKLSGLGNKYARKVTIKDSTVSIHGKGGVVSYDNDDKEKKREKGTATIDSSKNIVIFENVTFNAPDHEDALVFNYDTIATLTGCTINGTIVAKDRASVTIDNGAVTYEVNSAAGLTKALDAAKAGDTVKLIDDITTTAIPTIGNGVTLDLNGKTLTTSQTTTTTIGAATITSTATDKDDKTVNGKIVATGTIDANDTPFIEIATSGSKALAISYVDFETYSTVNYAFRVKPSSNVTLETVNISSYHSIFVLQQNSTVTANNSTITENYIGSISAIAIGDSAKLTLNNSNVYAEHYWNTAIYLGAANAAVEVLKGSVVSGSSYGIGTNASRAYGIKNVKVTVDNSTVQANNGAGILINVYQADIKDVIIKNSSKIYGSTQAMIVRGGKATIENSELGLVYNCKELQKMGDDAKLNLTFDQTSATSYGTGFSQDRKWTEGNDVFRAALTLGDSGDNNAYDYDTEVVVDNVTFITKVILPDGTTEGTSSYTTAIYAVGKEAKTVNGTNYNSNMVTLTIKGDKNDFNNLKITEANKFVSVTYEVSSEAELTAAIAKANDGDLIKLTADIKCDVVNASKTITIDLNGFTLSNASTTDSSHTITNRGKLTIVDSSSDNTGKVDNTVKEGQAVYNNEGGEVIIEGGTFTRSNSATLSGYVILNHGTMTINGGTVTSNSTFSSMIENGWYTPSDNKTEVASELTINGGTFTGGLNSIKNDSYGKLTITSGTFSNTAQHVILNYGDAEITGGTFTCTEPAFAVICNYNYSDSQKAKTLKISGETTKIEASDYGILSYCGETTITGGYIKSTCAILAYTSEAKVNISGATFDGYIWTYDNATVTITGGTINGSLYNAATLQDGSISSGTLKVSDGYFKTKPSEVYLAEGYEVSSEKKTVGEVDYYTIVEKTDAKADED
jgi:hypothetical protein